jgi:hypothetical protein
MANIEIDEEDKSMDICIDNNKYEISNANMVLKQPPHTVTGKDAAVVKEKKVLKKLSIIDPILLEHNTVQSVYKSHTPPYPPPFKPRIENDKPVSKSKGFKIKQKIVHRWADDIDTDTDMMSDYE